MATVHQEKVYRQEDCDDDRENEPQNDFGQLESPACAEGLSRPPRVVRPDVTGSAWDGAPS
jgi:hypothetical protein